MMRGKFHRTLLVAVALAAVAIAPASGHDRTSHGVLMDETDTAAPDPAYRGPDPATLGGDWDLVDSDGKPVTNKTWRGKWMMVFFGFAECREICPGALMTMTEALDLMGDEGDAIQPLFVDFSMEEPDLLALKQFTSNFHPRLIGLTGDRRQTFEAVRKFKVRREYMMTNFSSKETGPRIDHTTYVYVIDPEGLTRGYFIEALPAQEWVKELRYHMKKYDAEMKEKAL